MPDVRESDRVTITEPNPFAGVNARVQVPGRQVSQVRIPLGKGHEVLIPNDHLELRERQVWMTPAEHNTLREVLDTITADREMSNQERREAQAALESLMTKYSAPQA